MRKKSKYNTIGSQQTTRGERKQEKKGIERSYKTDKNN